LSHSYNPFVLVIFQIGSSFSSLASLDQDPLTYTSCVAGTTGMCCHT
jgi:hypothetical protein